VTVVSCVSYGLVIVSIALSGYQCLETGGISFNSAVPSATATSEGYSAGGDNGGENTGDSRGNDGEGGRETGGDVGGESTDTDMESEAPAETDEGELLTIEICNNGADDDGDGQIDFNDAECKRNNALPSIVTNKSTPPSGPGVPEICGDGIDNNGFDGIDEGCLGLQNRFPGDIDGVLAPERTEASDGWEQ
jgi:hypothetical protein